MNTEIPNREYFRIGEAARIAGVEPHVLRFWETEFPVLQPHKSQSRRRLYSRDDLALVLRIRDLLYVEGYTIPGARKRLRRRADSGASPGHNKELLEKIRKEAQELLEIVKH